MMISALRCLLLALSFHTAYGATAEDWRGRSVYQIIVDRYALPLGVNHNACDVANQTWCGGTWNTITANLDYIQNAGFTAVWISPIHQNYQGPRTKYGDPYHGHWMANVNQLNDKFGTADDLNALVSALHKRGMYIMVDVVVNDVMSINQIPDYSTYMFQQPSQYHPYCPVDYSNTTSEEICWLGDTNVYLPDLNTEDPTVMAGFQAWVRDFVQTYKIDGLRIDAAKHVNLAFWPPFAEAAGVFTIGEVDNADVPSTAPFQGPKGLDAILQYPMYNAIVETFAIPGPQNITALAAMINASQSGFSDNSVLGNFIENQDVPRWANISVDPQTLYNAMVWNFMSDGIPIVYYGQEQGMHGGDDPFNREPLWTSGYALTEAYNFTATLNRFRSWMIASTAGTPNDWLKGKTTVLAVSDVGLGFMKGDVVTIITNIGSPPQNVSIPVYTPYMTSYPLVNILTCQQWAVGPEGTVEMQYTEGGRPVILAPELALVGSGFCGQEAEDTTAGKASGTSSIAPSRWLLVWVLFMTSFV